MIRKLVHFAMRQRPLTLLMALLIVVGGIAAYLSLKIEAYPDVADTEVDVITKYPGRAATEVEQQVTIPIERALQSAPHIVSRRSKTTFGLSIVQMTFDESTSEFIARQLLIEKLRGADLPDGVTPDLSMPSPVGEIFRYVVEAKPGYSYSPMDLREVQDWVVMPKILKASGVMDVVNFGGLVKQYSVILDPLKLRKFGLSATTVQNAIQANNSNTGGNVIERGSQALSVRGIGRITSPNDIGLIVLQSGTTGTPIYVRDVGSVEITALPPSGIYGYTDNTRHIDVANGVQGLVLMRRGENPSDVLAAIKGKIEEVKPLLPEGVQLVTLYDRGELVENTLHTVSHTLIEGVTIVVIILLFFLGNVRAALLTAITIPLSLLWAFIVMKFTGIPANLLSLGAIDFGIIVDGSVIMTEAIMRRLSHASAEERATKGPLRLIAEATEEVDRQIFFSVVIIILAYLPLFTLTRVEGKLFSPMAYTLSFAIFGSLLLALTLVPVLATYLFRSGRSADNGGPHEWRNPIVEWIDRVYARIVGALIEYRTAVLTGALAIVGGALFLGAHLGSEFLPELDEGAIVIRTVLAPGVSLSEAARYPPIIRDIASSYPEVRAVITQLGRNDDGTDPYGPNRIETHVELRKYDTWPKGVDKHRLEREIKARLESRLPGASFSFSQPILDNVTEAVTGSSADLAVLIGGNDLTKLRSYADTVFRALRGIRGASETAIEQEGDQAELRIEVNREAAARYGINVRDIEDVIELAIAGKPVSTLYEGERKFDIVIRYLANARSTVDDVSKLEITSPTGQHIPLKELAALTIEDGATIIAREDGHRQIGVRTNVRDRDQGSFVHEAQLKVADILKLDRGYTIDWGGQFENLTRAKEHLIVIIPITLFLIFGLLFITFKSVRYALIVLVNVPLALVGGVLALWVRGINFSVSSGVGFISLFGVAVMSGVLLIARFNQLRFVEGLSLDEAVRCGAREELRPILMMMLVALLGLIPASLATGIGSDVQRPLATVIVGGLASALILTLLVLPALYYALERRAHRDPAALAVDVHEATMEIIEHQHHEEHLRELQRVGLNVEAATAKGIRHIDATADGDAHEQQTPESDRWLEKY